MTITDLIEKAIVLETEINAEITAQMSSSAKRSLYCAGSVLANEVLEWLRGAENERKKAEKP